jgi:hypothetical protein
MGLKAFRKIQISNAEGTPGTAEAATEILLGTMGTWEDENELHRPEEDRNSLAMYFEDDEFVSERAAAVWTGDLTFRQILYALLMTVRGNVTPTQPDSVDQPLAYLWTLTPALTTANTPDETDGIDTFTIEYGDDDQAYEMAYCFGTQLEISGSPNEPCQFTLNITGDKKTETTFTAALSAPTGIQRAPFNLAKFYIDAAGGTMGSNQKTGLLRGFTWRLNTQFAAFYTADGDLSYGSVVERRKAVELSLTYKAGALAHTERGFYDSRTTRLLRIQLNGQTELDSEEANPPYLNLDQAIRYENWPSWGDDDGVSTFEVNAYSVYNEDYAKLFEVSLLNALSTLPS